MKVSLSMKVSLRQAPDRVELQERLTGLDFCTDIRLPGVLTYVYL